MDLKKKKKDLPTCCPQETHVSFKNIDRLKEKGWKMDGKRRKICIFHANGNQKKAREATLIAEEIDIK